MSTCIWPQTIYFDQSLFTHLKTMYPIDQCNIRQSMYFIQQKITRRTQNKQKGPPLPPLSICLITLDRRFPVPTSSCIVKPWDLNFTSSCSSFSSTYIHYQFMILTVPYLLVFLILNLIHKNNMYNNPTSLLHPSHNSSSYLIPSLPPSHIKSLFSPCLYVKIMKIQRISISLPQIQQRAVTTVARLESHPPNPVPQTPLYGTAL